MNRENRHLITNMLSRGFTALVPLVMTPFYLHYLGIESYGLIGFYQSLVALTIFFDLGGGSGLNREMARLQLDVKQGHLMRETVRTWEWIYWSVGGALSLGVVIIAPYIATHWLHPTALSQRDVLTAVYFMGGVLFIQWPSVLYGNGLMGLHRQVLMNGILITFSILRALGGVVICLVSPQITHFFLWQIICWGVVTGASRLFLWRSLPKSGRPVRFQMAIVKRLWKFSAGITLISMFSIVLWQSDRIILSKFLSLEAFAYYAIAITAASALFQLAEPIVRTYYPHFVELFTQKREEELSTSYHRASQLAALFVFPGAMLLIFFAKDMVWLWTHNLEVAEHTAMLIPLLAISYMIYSLMQMPLTLQLASGWTKLGCKQNVIALCVQVPLFYLLGKQYGAYGIPWIMMLVQCGSLFIAVPVMHKKLLRREAMKWFRYTLIMPLLISGTVGAFLAQKISGDLSLVALLGVGLFLFVATGLTLPIFYQGMRQVFGRARA